MCDSRPFLRKETRVSFSALFRKRTLHQGIGLFCMRCWALLQKRVKEETRVSFHQKEPCVTHKRALHLTEKKPISVEACWATSLPCCPATHCYTLQHTAARCNALQHTATHCNALQNIYTIRATSRVGLHCLGPQRLPLSHTSQSQFVSRDSHSL